MEDCPGFVHLGIHKSLADEYKPTEEVTDRFIVDLRIKIVNGTCQGAGTASQHGVNVSGAATVTINNATGGSINSSYGVQNASTGVVTVNGTITGGSAVGTAFGVNNNSTGKILVTGPVTASATSAALGDNPAAAGLIQLAAGITVTNITGTGGNAMMAIYATHVALVGSITWIFSKSSAGTLQSGNTTLGAAGAALTVFSGN
jgi:hypothetical protein